MGRPPKVQENPDGSAVMRLSVGPLTRRLARHHAERSGTSEAQALRSLLGYIEALIYDGDLGWLPADWRHTHKLQRNADNGLPPGLVNVDLAKLHRSDKTRSGFVGVYANGKGFRAAGRHGESLGTYDSAEEAAWHRYVHYKQNGLPYGRLELEIDRYRRRGEQGTDAQLRELVLETARLAGTEHLYAEPGAVPSPSSDAPSPRIMGFGDGVALDAALAAASQHEADD